jgi:sugar/nucleoside kinase (ribokinase family)
MKPQSLSFETPFNTRSISFGSGNSKSDATKGNPPKEPIDIMVIGSMAVDITCTVPSLNRTSLPLDTATSSKMYATAGGVAHNVALAATYASPSSVQLLTAVGADPEGAWLAHYAQRAELDIKLISGTGETAKY